MDAEGSFRKLRRLNEFLFNHSAWIVSMDRPLSAMFKIRICSVFAQRLKKEVFFQAVMVVAD